MKKTVSILLTVLLVFGTISFALTAAAEAPAIIDQGYCGAEGDGTNVTWAFDSAGTLTISGRGAIKTYQSFNSTPWYADYRNDILSAIVEDGVTNLSRSLFSNCKNMKTVTIGESVSSIADSPFGGCQSLTTIHFPSNIEHIELLDLENTPWYAAQPDGLLYIGKVAYKFKGVMPEGTSVDLREDCVEIGPWAFGGCSGLTGITLPDGLKRLKQGAFSGCTSLEEITLPANLETISSNVFSGCSGLTHMTIPDSVTMIGSGAFQNCTGLIGVENLSHAGNLGQGAFKNCTSLTSASIPEGESIIWAGTFDGCTSLKEVTIPDSVTAVFQYVFRSCSALESIHLPDSITRISTDAFKNCTSLKSITLPKNLAEYDMDFSAFKGCSALSSIDVAPGNTMYYSVDNCVIKRDTKTLVLACRTSVIPTDGSVTRIGDYAFANAPETVLIPSFIQTFGKCIFADCVDLKTAVFQPGITTTPEDCLPKSVTKIVIPDTVTKIDSFLCRNYTGVYGPVSQNTSDGLEIFYTGSEEQWNQINIRNWAETYPNQNIINATKHFDYQFQTVAETPSTCTEPGYTEGLYCDVADLWVSGHEALPLADHTPAAAVRENEAAATCTEAGGYDEVIYCTKCPAVISRNHIEVPATDHNWGEWVVVKQATVDETGLMRRTCQNDASHVEEQVIPKLKPNTTVFQQFIEWVQEIFQDILDWFSRLFRW